METKHQKIKIFFDKHHDALLCVCFVILFFNIFMMVGGIYPYGDSTMLLSDSYSQIGRLFSHIFAWLRGESTLFYTNNIGGGMEIFSTIEYMFFNPFYLLVLVFGEVNVLKSVALSVLGMLIFNCLVFLWFEKKYFKNLSLFKRIIFALGFTFGMFVNFSYSFTTWLIIPGLTLLLIDGFLRIINDGKITRFVIILVWFVVNCYSIGFSANIILVLLFSLYILFCTDRESMKSHFVKLLVAYILAVLICIILLFPSITAMLDGSRLSSFSSVFDLQYYSSRISGLFFDFALLFFTIAYFFMCDRKNPKNKFLIVTFILCILLQFSDGSAKIISGGVFIGFVNRFSFIYEILLFICSMRFFSENTLITKDCRSKKSVLGIYISAVVLALLLLALYVLVKFDGIGTEIKNPVNSSYGTPTIYFGLFALTGLALFLSIFFNKRGIFSAKAAKVASNLALVVMVCFNYIAFCSVANLEKSDNTVNITLSSSGFKLNDSKINNVYYYNIYSSDVHFAGAFTSLLSSRMLNSFGRFLDLTFYSSLTCNSTLVQDALLGVKYVLSDYEMERPYLTLLYNDENHYIYQNELVSSGAFVFDENYSYDDDATNIENMQKIARSMGLELGFYEDIEYVFESVELATDLSEVESAYKVTFTAPCDGIIYGLGKLTSGETGRNTKLATIGEDVEEKTLVIKNTNKYFLCDMDYLEAGETYSFYILLYSDDLLEDLNFKFLNYGDAVSFCEALQSRQCDFTYTKTGYSVTVPEDASGKLFVFSADIKGLNYTYNGEGVSISHECEFFTTLLVNGGGTFVASYSYPYTPAYIIAVLLAIFFIALVIVLYRKNKFEKHKFGIYIFMCGVCGGIIAVVFILGGVLTICSIFM